MKWNNVIFYFFEFFKIFRFLYIGVLGGCFCIGGGGLGSEFYFLVFCNYGNISYL